MLPWFCTGRWTQLSLLDSSYEVVRLWIFSSDSLQGKLYLLYTLVNTVLRTEATCKSLQISCVVWDLYHTFTAMLWRCTSWMNFAFYLLRTPSYKECFDERCPVICVSVNCFCIWPDRKSTRLNSSHVKRSRMPSSAWKKKNLCVDEPLYG